MSKPESNWKSNCTPCCRAHYATKSGYKRLYIYLYIYILISVYIRVRIPISMCHVGLYLCGWPSPLPMWNAFLYIWKWKRRNNQPIYDYLYQIARPSTNRPPIWLPARPSIDRNRNRYWTFERPPAHQSPARLPDRTPARPCIQICVNNVGRSIKPLCLSTIPKAPNGKPQKNFNLLPITRL